MDRPILYIKPGCPWCTEALSFFSKHKVALDVRDVLTDRKSMQRMNEVSGQGRTPTMEYDGFVVADFSVDEFLVALDEKPDVRRKLGLEGVRS